MCLLEQDTTRKGRIDEKTAEKLEFEAGGNNKEYEIEGIRNSAVHARESEADHLPGLYYLVSWKGYLKDESTWEPASAVQHHRKLVSTFYKDYSDKPKAISPPMDLTTSIAKSTAPPNVNGKQKRGWPIGSVRMKTKH